MRLGFAGFVWPFGFLRLRSIDAPRFGTRGDDGACRADGAFSIALLTKARATCLPGGWFVPHFRHQTISSFALGIVISLCGLGFVINIPAKRLLEEVKECFALLRAETGEIRFRLAEIFGRFLAWLTVCTLEHDGRHRHGHAVVVALVGAFYGFFDEVRCVGFREFSNLTLGGRPPVLAGRVACLPRSPWDEIAQTLGLRVGPGWGLYYALYLNRAAAVTGGL